MTRASSPSASGLVVATVSRHSPVVRLFRVDRQRNARPVWSVPPPKAGLLPIRVALDATSAPDLCVVWGTLDSNGEYAGAAIRCYRYGSPTGVALPVTGMPSDVALSADGSAVLWHATSGAFNTAKYTDAIYTAHLDHGRVDGVRRFVVSHGAPEEFSTWGCQTWVVSALWVDDAHLLLECNGANDEPGGLAVENLLPDKGSSTRPGRHLSDWSLEAPGAIAGGRVATLARTDCPSAGLQPCPDVAVTVPVGGGPTRSLATASSGRTVTSVSGGNDALLYVTDAFKDANDHTQRDYLKYPTDAVGAPVTGLPAGIRLIALQP